MKEEIHSPNCLDNYGIDYGSEDPGFHTSRCTSDVPEVKDESLEICMSMLQISDNIENLLRILYPVLFLIFNIVYWLTFRKLA